MNKKILKKVRHKFGIRILTGSCVECKFCEIPDVKNGFNACSNPLVGVLSKSYGNALIVNCPDEWNPKKCKYFIHFVKELKSDLGLIKKYILKYREGKWLLVKDNHLTKLSKKTKIKNKEYILRLVMYFGYVEAKSPKMESQINSEKYENMTMKNLKRTIKRELRFNIKELKGKKKDELIEILIGSEIEKIEEKTVQGILFTNDWSEIKARYLFTR